MAENMVVPVTGGCPKCGEPNIPVPVDYNDDTIITCPKCGYEAPMGEVLFAHVYGMNAIPAPLPAALVDRGRRRLLHRDGRQWQPRTSPPV
jgi:hypothetical protein